MRAPAPLRLAPLLCLALLLLASSAACALAHTPGASATSDTSSSDALLASLRALLQQVPVAVPKPPGQGGTPVATDGGGARVANPTQQFVLTPLPYDYGAIEPVVDARTMQLHHDFHQGVEYVPNLNAAMKGNFGGSDNLPGLVSQVGLGALPPDQELAVRNFGGGHWNHAMFWKVMATPGSANTSRDAISPELRAALEGSFGSVDQALAVFKDVADKHFGSGWSWLCVAAPGQLKVVDSTNQDNPLMPVLSPAPCVPILGLDVWEHAFYLKYGPEKPAYTAAWTSSAINWAQVSANYASATSLPPLEAAAAIGTAF